MKHRIIWEKLEKEIDTKEIVVITGPRQVGKTTTLNWILNKIPSENKIYFDLQNIANKEIFENKNFDLVIEELQNSGLSTDQKMYVAIDEIQLLKTLPSTVKYLHDHYNIKFFLTGSSSFYIKNRFTESMAGRKIIYEMHPLRFQEFLTFKNVGYKLAKNFNIGAKFNNNTYNKLSGLYNEYIKYGGLPKIALTQDVGRKKKLLEEIFSSYITVDVEALADFKSSTDLRKLIKLLASQIGNKINITNLSKIIGVSRPTINTYLEFLEKTYLIKTLRPYSKSEKVKTRLAPKIYFVDTGIASLNADLSGGAKYENTVQHQLSFYGNLSYYSNRSSEIDFILNDEIAFEVKKTPTDTHLTKLKKKSEKIDIKKYSLIGKERTAKFDGYLWGGLIK